MDEKRYDGVEELRQLTYKDEEAFKVYIQEWYDNDEKVVPGNTNLKEYQSFKAMADELNQEKPRRVVFLQRHYSILLMEISWAQ